MGRSVSLHKFWDCWVPDEKCQKIIQAVMTFRKKHVPRFSTFSNQIIPMKTSVKPHKPSKVLHKPFSTAKRSINCVVCWTIVWQYVLFCNREVMSKVASNCSFGWGNVNSHELSFKLHITSKSFPKFCSFQNAIFWKPRLQNLWCWSRKNQKYYEEKQTFDLLFDNNSCKIKFVRKDLSVKTAETMILFEVNSTGLEKGLKITFLKF